MKERDPLDEFLRQQLSDRTYDFKQSYWEAASALIEADARRRRRFWWWLGGLSLLVLLSGSLWALWPAQARQQLQPLPPLAQQPALPHSDTETPMATKISPLAPVSLQPADGSSRDKSAPVAANEFSASPPLISRSTANHVADSLPSSPAAATGKPVAAGSPRVRRELGPIDSLPAWRWPWQQLRLAAVRRYGDPPSGKAGRHSLGLTLGAAYSPAWATDAAANSPEPVAGLHYSLRLNRRLRLQTGLLYQVRSGLGLDSLFRSVDFGFGAEVTTVNRSPRRLHFLEIPLTLEWRLHHRHYLQAGGYAAGLLDVSGRQSQREGLAESVSQEARGFGFRQGFRRLDYGLAAGYQYYLGQGLRLGGSLRYGLRDLSEDSFYGAGRFDRSLQFRLTFSYDFLHF